QPGRCVTAPVQRLLDCSYVEDPVLDESVVWRAGVVLQLVVAPAADPLARVVVVEAVAGVEIPLRFVDFRAVELVAPDQLPPGRDRFGGLVHAGEGKRDCCSDEQRAHKPASDSRHPILPLPKWAPQMSLWPNGPARRPTHVAEAPNRAGVDQDRL